VHSEFSTKYEIDPSYYKSGDSHFIRYLDTLTGIFLRNATLRKILMKIQFNFFEMKIVIMIISTIFIRDSILDQLKNHVLNI